ncbi:transcriptional regulator PpsR [Azohydromonas sediminis]|uniref:transcriptional regulator PpsR n=1 Tax=Azohydromonas sediminis TaxID=2259674 RepID=UPI000E6584B0|nr:transcriptional regulator PpsR [Azohydromonas sediminis]
MKAFDAPAHALGDLDATAAAAIIAAAADIALILDDDGVIVDVACSGEGLDVDCRAWIGKPWAQTVTAESRPKVEALLAESAAARTAPKWRHINHPQAGGAPDLPLMYTAVALPRGGARAAAVGRRVAFARDLRANVALQQRLVKAQQTMERDYWRLRHMETRYRLLFQVASEAVLILDASTLRLEEANPAASRLFGDALRRSGWTLPESFEPETAATLQATLAAVRATGRGDQQRARLADGREVLVSLSLFRQEKTSHFLVRVSPTANAGAAPEDEGHLMLARLMEVAPDAFVITDADGRVLSANRAFLDLAQLNSEEQARGQLLGTWLGRTGVEMSVLITTLRSSGVVRLFATQLRGAVGSTVEVEVSAVAVEGVDPPCLGFVIRDVGLRLPAGGAEGRAARELPRSVGQMTELVGRVPLKEIVRDTTDLIEQLCIEAALQLTNDNRASAAEMLGLSRQSLYVKMRRYELGDLTSDSEE